ncbi:hypothetical protein N7466_001590 [Penicillium verhagenii]|uniref:uncharacterized protein n=1 Tax=Penicillium verhagenii TaxID=1562060 RepID=UPI002544F247|nr:uncharacterized protein N7466_001590 [Penicillium verhagenii]KAJ5938456.1 hypothetical protein N7466_001590 [Penicillium verhagenii]
MPTRPTPASQHPRANTHKPTPTSQHPRANTHEPTPTSQHPRANTHEPTPTSQHPRANTHEPTPTRPTPTRPTPTRLTLRLTKSSHGTDLSQTTVAVKPFVGMLLRMPSHLGNWQRVLGNERISGIWLSHGGTFCWAHISE